MLPGATGDSPMTVECVFPQAIWRTQYTGTWPDWQTEPARGQFSLNRTVLDLPHYLELRTACLSAVQDYNRHIIHSPQTEFYITQSWISQLTDHEPHPPHCHPNSILSGVVYLACADPDWIVFERANPWPIEFSAKRYTVLNSNIWHTEVRTGDILIFSSNLRHQVPAQPRAGVRASLAFNTWCRGPVGDPDSLTYLNMP